MSPVPTSQRALQVDPAALRDVATAARGFAAALHDAASTIRARVRPGVGCTGQVAAATDELAAAVADALVAEAQAVAALAGHLDQAAQAYVDQDARTADMVPPR